MRLIFIFVYRFLFFPIVMCVTLLLLPFHKKTAQNLKLRRTKTLPRSFPSRPIWIHASSGEFEYAKPVIREIKNEFPNIPVMVTYSSPSYAKQIESFPGVDVNLPLPIDLPGPLYSFIKKSNPLMLLVARTDYWPEALMVTKQKGIPSLAFSCTFRPLTGWRKLIAPFYKFIFNQFSNIYVVSNTDKLNIEKSGTTTAVTTTGDTRFDQVVYRLQHPKALRDDLFTEVKNKILVVGSSWPPDEDAVLTGTLTLLKNKSLKIIFAPHEPTATHLERLENEIKKMSLTSSRYSTTQDFSADIMIMDQVGLLAELYLKGDFALVGGSFRKKVHSVMEPLAAGLITFVGPHHTNNREAMEFQEHKSPFSPNMSAVIAVQNAKDLELQLQQLLTSDLKSNREWIRSLVASRTKATQHVLTWIKQVIKTNHQETHT